MLIKFHRHINVPYNPSRYLEFKREECGERRRPKICLVWKLVPVHCNVFGTRYSAYKTSAFPDKYFQDCQMPHRVPSWPSLIQSPTSWHHFLKLWWYLSTFNLAQWHQWFSSLQHFVSSESLGWSDSGSRLKMSSSLDQVDSDEQLSSSQPLLYKLLLDIETWGAGRWHIHAFAVFLHHTH